MKFQKITTIFFLILVIDLIIACRGCNCVETQELYYTFDTLIANNLDNSGVDLEVKDDDIILKEAFGIRLQFLTKQLAYNNETTGSLFTGAYAWSKCPPEFQFLPEDSVVSLNILTINEFDGSHPGNSNINDYFKIFIGSNYFPISETSYFLKRTFDEKLENETLDLLLMTPPEFTGEHRFIIETELSNGRVLSASTLPVRLE